eukprot:CAMPEP_0197055108 /NCGR_PEP_ID=MMETSP1384-20130603/57782_1 /TAXON_ID=29189 /ORGANISM="Ammonia sp." /LENGTH=352 /DNA_ID=CAMNT_0042488563 /DNA_START=79 /DNA_END=1137 /DNA_ORIENTATION=+
MTLQTSSFGFNVAHHSNEENVSIKLVIYDFDQTITCEHLYYALEGGQEDALSKMTDDRLLKIFGGKERTERLHQHFERISSKSEVAIISFGWVNVIRLALQRMNLGQYFEKAVIIGKDSEELKTAGSKAKCISMMKKERTLKSDQVMFVDDDATNVSKAQSYSQTVTIVPRNGMTFKHMQEIEEKVGVYPSEPLQMEITTPKTVASQMTKQYPSHNELHDHKKQKSSLDKYRITKVPDWFESLTNPKPETPVIQIGGDQTPGSDSEYELNVPVLNSELENVAKKQEAQQPANIVNGGLSLNFGGDADDENNQNHHAQLACNTDVNGNHKKDNNNGNDDSGVLLNGGGGGADQ